MRYKVIRQFQTQSELFCGAFDELNDAEKFIVICVNNDKATAIHTVYWLFDTVQEMVLHTSDNPKKLISRYVENIELLPETITNPFNVVTLDNQIELKIAEFTNILDARKFIEAKLNQSDSSNDSSVYCIFDGDKFCEKFDKTSAQSGDKKESKKIFRPTPLPTKPRLGPANYWVDEDEDKNKDE